MNIKQVSLAAALALFTISFSFAQKWAYVDTEYILANIPEYKAAQSELDRISAEWQKQIEAKYTEIDRLKESFEAEKILLTDDMKKKRLDEIAEKEKEAKDLQREKFGVDGELFKKRQELVKPVQDKVFNAVKAFAEKGLYVAIFDKASDLTILYSSPKYDKSDDILVALGYKKTATKK